MKLKPEQIDGLMNLIGLTRADEINCNECLEQVAEFAENHLEGRPVPLALRAVEHHLKLCAECREEYEALRKAIAGLDDQARD